MQYYVIDAFTDELFRGNPAGVCLPDRPLSDELMQKIAFENNLAETAFLYQENNTYHLRWFTPETEIDLCGHATLATAFVMMNFVSPDLQEITFHTMSGALSVTRRGAIYTMDFPSRPPQPTAVLPLLEQALGCPVLETHQSRDLLVLAQSEQAVRDLRPDLSLLMQISRDIAFGIIVTAKGEHCDFVSRFFAPNAGIAEDPVTGSSHSTLIPFWAQRLGKMEMTAKQLSPRGGTLQCTLCGDRVQIGGTAVCYLTGKIDL